MPIKPDDEDYAAAAADPMNQGRPDGEMYRFVWIPTKSPGRSEMMSPGVPT